VFKTKDSRVIVRYDDRIGRPTLELVNPIILILLIRVATIHFTATNLYYPTFSCEILVNLDHCPNCQKRVMPASFTGFTSFSTVKLPSKDSSTLFDVQTFIFKGKQLL